MITTFYVVVELPPQYTAQVHSLRTTRSDHSDQWPV